MGLHIRYQNKYFVENMHHTVLIQSVGYILFCDENSHLAHILFYSFVLKVLAIQNNRWDIHAYILFSTEVGLFMNR